jgi:hypothetical protein
MGHCIYTGNNTTEAECDANGSSFNWIEAHNGIDGHCAYDAGYTTEEQCTAGAPRDNVVWIPAHGGVDGHCVLIGATTEAECYGHGYDWIDTHDMT